MKTREQQRQQQAHQSMSSFGLYCHLLNLSRDILAGDTAKIPEFQQFIQYAPAGMKDQLRDHLQLG